MQNKVSTDFWNNFEGLELYKFANVYSTLICLGSKGMRSPVFRLGFSRTGPFGELELQLDPSNGGCGTCQFNL